MPSLCIFPESVTQVFVCSLYASVSDVISTLHLYYSTNILANSTTKTLRKGLNEQLIIKFTASIPSHRETVYIKMCVRAIRSVLILKSGKLSFLKILTLKGCKDP